MRRFVTTVLLLCIAAPAVATATPSDQVERVLRARVLTATGIYAPFVGTAVTVTMIYDATLAPFGAPGGLSTSFRNFSPPSNIGKAMGIRIRVGGIVRSTEGAADHKIEMLDTEFLDQWSMDVVDFASLHQASITLRGGADFLLPGTGVMGEGGLTGDINVFPGDVCDPDATLTIGNFGSGGGAGEVGTMTYDFRMGPDCTGVSTTTTTTTTTISTTTMPPVSSGICGDPVALVAGGYEAPSFIAASDALFTLSAAVGISACELCVCDVNDSGSISATDALGVLNAAVSLPIVLECPPCACEPGEVRVDGVCLSTCGNGVVDEGEQCDDGNTIDTDDCTDCVLPVCGDGTTNGDEECDDANTDNDDGCTNSCVCSSPDCDVPCGNGAEDPGEECDDGNAVNDDGCTNFCTLPVCGDGIVQAGEDCDDGNNEEPPDVCPNDCMQ